MIRLLMIGDIVGTPGQTTLMHFLPKLKQQYRPDVIVVNGENAAEGRGITRQIFKEMLGAGVDCVTLGNHAWDKREIFDFIDNESRIIRPANYPDRTPGQGYTKIPLKKGELVVISLMGRTFLSSLDDPFRKADDILAKLKPQSMVLVDIHAETTSEKQALGWYLDGRVSAVVGTHTHVQTGDERILPEGTAYITDVGMVGPYDGVLGMDRDLVLKRFLTQLPVRFEVGKGRTQLNGVIIDIHPSTGKARNIQRIRMDDDQPWFE